MKKGPRKTAEKTVQKLLPFDAPDEPDAAPLPETTTIAPIRKRCTPSDEALAAFERLEGWLRDPRTGKPVNDAADETLRSLSKALLEGKNAWHHYVEERLEGLLACPSAVSVRVADEDRFRDAVDDVLDRLHERLADRGR